MCGNLFGIGANIHFDEEGLFINNLFEVKLSKQLISNNTNFLLYWLKYLDITKQKHGSSLDIARHDIKRLLILIGCISKPFNMT